MMEENYGRDAYWVVKKGALYLASMLLRLTRGGVVRDVVGTRKASERLTFARRVDARAAALIAHGKVVRVTRRTRKRVA